MKVRRHANGVRLTRKARQIDRHRHLVVRNKPVAVDLPKARRRPNPETGGRGPVLQRAAEPIAAVREYHVIAHGNSEVANLVTERLLVRRKDAFPVFPFCFCFHMLQWWFDGERHDV